LADESGLVTTGSVPDLVNWSPLAILALIDSQTPGRVAGLVAGSAGAAVSAELISAK
jgi:hypothetical protein